jgi:aminomethyltransferase
LPGAARLSRELDGGLTRQRVGLRILEGAPARTGAPILAAGSQVGIVTSGGYSPCLAAPIAMGFLPPRYAGPGTRVSVQVRNRESSAEVVALPFVAHRYVRNA